MKNRPLDLKLISLVASVLLIAGCTDTSIHLDLREPTNSIGQLEVNLKQSAIDLLKVKHSELLQGRLTESAKQNRTCELFFQDYPKIARFFSQPSPWVENELTVNKRTRFDGNALQCAFKAQGPLEQVLEQIEQPNLLAFSLAEDRLNIRLNTQQSEFESMLPFSWLGWNKQHTDIPTLFVEIQGHDLQTDFSEGQVNSTRFELSENLFGERLHYTSEFNISIQSSSPSLIDRLEGLYDEFVPWIKKKLEELNPENEDLLNI